MVALALPRLGVGREVIGEWEGLIYLGAVLSFGWLTGLSQAYLTSVRGAGGVVAYSRRVVTSVLLVSAGLLAVAAGAHEWLYRLLKLGTPPAGWWYFFVFLLIQWPSIFFEQALQVRGRAWSLAIFGALSGLGYATAVILPIYLGGELVDALRWLAALAGLKGMGMFGYLYLSEQNDAKSASTFSGGDGKGAVLKLWRTARPLIFYVTVGYMVMAFDPWFVNYWYEDDESLFAVFRYGARDIPFVAAITSGMIAVVLPLLTEDVSAGLQQLRASASKLYHWVFGGTLVLMLTAPYWWVPLFTELFVEGLPLFRIFLFITVSRLLFPMPVIVALGYTRGLWLFSFSELVMNVLLTFLLVPRMGLPGVIVSTVISDIVNKLVLMAFLFRKSGIGPSRYTNIPLLLLYSGVLCVAYLVG